MQHSPSLTRSSSSSECSGFAGKLSISKMETKALQNEINLSDCNLKCYLFTRRRKVNKILNIEFASQ